MGDLTRRPDDSPAKREENKQFDLFTEFFAGGSDRGEFSNTIEFWDAIPKYAVSARRQASLRTASGTLPIHKYAFKGGDYEAQIVITPAKLEMEDGDTKEFYPSADEELVEEVLRKFLADQRYGSHEVRAEESKVRFTLSMIRAELKARGKTRSIPEIKRSLEILKKTTIEVKVKGQARLDYAGNILNEVIYHSRSVYLDDPTARGVAYFPPMVSRSINELTYRQINYGTLMTLSSQLCRWLHKRLSHRYTNASTMQSHELLYSTIKRDSGLLESKNDTKNRATLEAALDELTEQAVLLGWGGDSKELDRKPDIRRGQRNKITDVLYRLVAHPDFAHDMRAANGRRKDALEKMGRPAPRGRKQINSRTPR